MMIEEKSGREGKMLKKLIIPMILGGIAGFLIAHGIFEGGAQFGSEGLSGSATIATLAGSFYIVMAIFVGGGTLLPGAGAQVLNVEDADELREQRSMLLLSSIAMVFWGAALVVLALSGPEAIFPAGPALGAAGVLYAIGTYSVIKSYAASDELMMAVNQEAASWAYGLLFVLLGGWSAFAHSGYAVGPQPLDILSAFYAIVLISTFIAAGRRGMLKIR